MAIIQNEISGISVGIELCTAIFCLLLFFAMKASGRKTRELASLEVFTFILACTAWIDLMSFLLEGTPLFRNAVIIVTLLSFLSMTISFVAFLRFLINHYDTKRKYCYPAYGWNLLLIYTVIVIALYISSIWNGAIFSISENAEYTVGPWAILVVLAYLPYMTTVLFIVLQNRKLVESYETWILLGFDALFLIFGALDVVMDTAFRFVALSVFNAIIYFVILVMQENERAQRDEAQRHSRVIDEANKSKMAFFGNISHDIKTSLTNISGFALLAKNNLEDSEKVNLYLEKISQSNELLISLVNDIMEMNFIENGAIELEELPISIHENIHFIEMMISGDLEAKEQELIINATELSQDIIYTDKLRLNQVLMNLLNNAIKYSDHGEKIEFFVTEKEKPDPKTVIYEFKVKDNGIGMSRLTKNNIFDSYEKDRSIITNTNSGNGLGMAITKRIVDLMNGTIEVESELGQGSTFIVTIPFRMEEEEKGVKDIGKGANASDISGKKLLIVEDNELNREIATEMLEDEGFIIDSASDGDIAVEKMIDATEDTYDLILMDIQMPKLNGLDATRQIRSLDNPWAKKIPIIAMSANSYKEDVDKSLEAGMDAHIAKPLDIDALLEVISKL